MLFLVHQVLADDTNQDRLRSFLLVFKAAREFVSEYETSTCPLIKFLFSTITVLGRYVFWSISFPFENLVGIFVEDGHLQSTASGSVRHAVSFASGKRVAKLTECLGLSIDWQCLSVPNVSRVNHSNFPFEFLCSFPLASP